MNRTVVRPSFLYAQCVRSETGEASNLLQQYYAIGVSGAAATRAMHVFEEPEVSINNYVTDNVKVHRLVNAYL